MTSKILFVDDEANVLEAYQRALRKRFKMDTAMGGEQALAMIASQGPYAVIVSDMRMPGMNGVELLAAAKERAPETVRMMLTGNSVQQTAIDAVNQGDIFRFLNKPCAPENLAKALDAGIEQYRLIVAEKELLEKTLRGSIQVLADILSLVNPEAFGRTTRIKRYMLEVAMQIDHPKIWWMEILALLSQVGCVILPEDALNKISSGDDLTDEETQLFEQHPMLGSDLLHKIPRLEEIAECIKYQEKHFDGTGTPRDSVSGKDIPLGARILKAILDFDKYQTSGLSRPQSLKKMKQHTNRYDPDILITLDIVIGKETSEETQEFKVFDLKDGMILAKNLETTNGTLIMCKGQEVTASVRQRLMNFRANGSFKDPVYISVTDRIDPGAQASWAIG